MSRHISKFSLGVVLSAAFLSQHAGGAVPFSAGPTLAAALRPGGAAVADFNGDRIADIATTVDTPDRVLIFFGTAGGTFGAPATFLLPQVGVRDVLATDLDGDRDVDLVVLQHNANTVRALLNNGAGTFTLGSAAAIGNNGRGISMGDLDGDGDMDFAVANRDDGTVTVIRNDAGTLVTATTLTAGQRPVSTVIADLDGDGRADVAVANNRSANVMTWRSTGAFAFAAPQTFGAAGLEADGIAAGDLNGDNKQELAVAAHNDGNTINALLVFTNTGTSGSIAFAGPAQFATNGVESNTVRIGDLNADRKRDVVVTNRTSGNVSVFDNTGVGAALGFAAPVLLTAGTSPETLTIADLGGSATPEIIVANRDSNNINIFINGSNPATCPADVDNGTGTGTPDGGVGIEDLLYYIEIFAQGVIRADLDDGSGTGTRDGGVTIDDLLYFLSHYSAGC